MPRPLHDLTRAVLVDSGKSYLRDAVVLCEAGSHHNAYYLAGYSAEFFLKARVVKHLRWDVYRTNGPYGSFKTHDLEVLLTLTGLLPKVKGEYLSEWSTVVKWNVELRYDVNPKAEGDAKALIAAVTTLRPVLLR